MTNEEKISRLKDILSEINENDNAVCYLTSEDNELIESAIEALDQAPTAEEKALLQKWRDNRGISIVEFEEAMDALQQEPCEDAISRDDALMCMTGEYIADKEYKPDDIISKHIRRLRALPSVRPKYNANEWCKDCKEYDRDKHCCPRFNKVIRSAVEEIKQPKMGHWERHYSRPNVYADLFWHCSECGYKNIDNYTNLYYHYCPNCGAKMVEPQESER